jgi:hypothetical protein
MFVAAMKLDSSYAVCGRSRVHTHPEASGAETQEVAEKCGVFDEGVTRVGARRARSGADHGCRPLLSGQRAGESVFGHLATFFVLLIDVYLRAIAFLVGIQLDACVRERA